MVLSLLEAEHFVNKLVVGWRVGRTAQQAQGLEFNTQYGKKKKKKCFELLELSARLRKDMIKPN
jgi:hypothetical protein